MSKYGLHGKPEARPGNGAQLVQILLEASKFVAKAKGCRLYLVSQEAASSDNGWVTEVWDSKEDHDNSLQVPGVKELIAAYTNRKISIDNYEIQFFLAH